MAKARDLEEVGADELLLGCLLAVAQFGVVRLGGLTLDMEELGVDWTENPDRAGAKVAYSKAVVDLMDRAARIAGKSHPIGVEHLLASFAGEESGLMGELKQRHGITSASWRTALAQLVPATTALVPTEPKVNSRDYLTPEEAAAALGIHVQTVRGYVRSGKLPALRLAGERAIRIRRSDLEKVMEPVVPEK